jgi:hypothetical protein
MMDRRLARLMAAIHGGYVLFVLLGSLLVLRWPALIWVHAAAVLWAFLTLAFDMGCPLTPWEKAALKRGGVEPYPEGFVQHYLLRSRFSADHSRAVHASLGVLVLVFNITVYWFVFRRR